MNATPRLIRVADAAMLQQVAEDLNLQRPYSNLILGPIRCRQLNELPYNFYIDQWPSLNVCIGLLNPEYFYKFETPPYTIMQFYAKTNDSVVIRQAFDVGDDVLSDIGSSDFNTHCRSFLRAFSAQRLDVDWTVPIVLAGPNAPQMSVIAEIFKPYGTIKHHERGLHHQYVLKKEDMKVVPVPEGYEYITLDPSEYVKEVGRNWNYVDNPYKLADVKTLMECFHPFRGIRHKATGKLVAHEGQLHSGCAAIGWVHPEHRGKKLFQAIVSNHGLEIIERHGFVFGNVIEGNVASMQALARIGMKHEEGHMMYMCHMTPHGSKNAEMNEFTLTH